MEHSLLSAFVQLRALRHEAADAVDSVDAESTLQALRALMDAEMRWYRALLIHDPSALDYWRDAQEELSIFIVQMVRLIARVRGTSHTE